jgi:hypothetical protein
MARKGVFDFNTLTPALKRLLPKVDAAVDLVFDLTEADAETYMRINAPWTDETGNARGGLFAKHQGEPMVIHQLVMYHTMPYGYWLEVRWSGRYAIIGPTMFHFGPIIASNVAAAVARAIRES